MKTLRLCQYWAPNAYGALSRTHTHNAPCHGCQFHISHKRDPFPYTPPRSDTDTSSTPPKFTKNQKFSFLLASIGAGGSIIYSTRKKPPSEGLAHAVQSSASDTEAPNNQTPAGLEDNNEESSAYPALSHEAAGADLEDEDHVEKERGVTRFYQFHPRYWTLQHDNSATHLAKNALVGKHLDVFKGLLSLRVPETRTVRDNITIRIIFFDEDPVDETSE